MFSHVPSGRPKRVIVRAAAFLSRGDLVLREYPSKALW
jgi:hypothetical protein